MTHNPSILFRDDATGEVMLFAEPLEIIVAHTRAEILPGLDRMQAARAEGRWLAGYMSYEAGYIFEDRLAPLIEDDRETPLMVFGVFDAPQPEDHPLATRRHRTENEPFLTQAKVAWDFPSYKQRFDRLHQHLGQGDCYQGNLTMPITARWNGDPLAAFWSLIERQPVKYGAFVDLGGPIILSRSPELFFRTDKEGWIETHPMKGTARRGSTPEEDAAIVEAMRQDIKTQAENRMIVDLLRNDISRITEVGTLDVPKLFDIETYPTVHQMVSHVQARLQPDLTIHDIFAALFPCGSITGAPKLWAMEILHDLETGPRDAYCGAIGMIAPSGAMRFSVAIRTITLFEDGRAIFNVGGGIVFDSTAEAEYEECLLKARFAVGDAWIDRYDLLLIETLRFEPEQGFIRLRLHLARLHRSARRLGFALPIGAAAGLRDAVTEATGPLRVRLTSDAQGRIQVTSAPFTPLAPDTVWKVRIATTRLQSSDKLLRIKTTRRAMYEAARAEYTTDQADEVLMLNERGEVCEGTITSVFLDDGSGRLRTPPIACGLLAGVLRTELICLRKAHIGRISVEDLKAGKVYMGNSLRGLIAANLILE